MYTVGYIGLGIMGKAMARNIKKAGFQIIVHNRSRNAVKELVAEGALEGVSPADVAGRSDIICTNLPDSPDVEAVVLGKNGVLEAAHEGQVFIDNLNIVLDTAREYGVPLPVTAETSQLYNAMLQMGMAELDNSAVIGVLEALAGTDLNAEG